MVMNTLEPDERAALRDAFRRLLTDRNTEADVRRVMETDSGYDQDLWRQLSEMGVTGLLIDPAYGGSGAGPVELEEIMEEAGAALLCGPLFSSSVLAAGLLGACGDRDAQSRLLPRIADGSLIASVAITGDKGLWSPEGVDVTAQTLEDGWTLSGTASYVTHGQQAGSLLVVAGIDADYGVFEVDPDAANISIVPMKTLDRTLRLARIQFNATAATRIADAGWEAVERALNLARVAMAGEQAGAAERLFDMTVEYVKNRYQFGRPVGGFQAIKHMAADLLIEKESAISAARHASACLASGSEDAEAEISLAAFYCADAFSKIAFDSIQMHGGIAYTWEYPAHLYLRRARADAQLFGSPSFYRERYVEQLSKKP